MARDQNFVWDEQKRESNLAKHGVDFSDIDRVDWGAAIYQSQLIRGDERLLCYAPIDTRLYAIVIQIVSDAVRVISFRKANTREVRNYVAEAQN